MTIESMIDQDGHIRYVSIVPPLSADEHAALVQAIKTWKNQPTVWLHKPPEAQIIQLGRVEPEIEDTP